MESLDSDYSSCFRNKKVADRLARECINVEVNDIDRCKQEEIFELEDSDADEDELIALLETHRRQLYQHSIQDFSSCDPKEKDQSNQEINDSEPDDCLLEEFEAKLIQQHYAELFNEYEFDAELRKIDNSFSIPRCEEKLQDFSSFSVNGKWQLLCRKSPELLPLMSKYKAVLYDLQKKLVPIHEYCYHSPTTHNNVYPVMEENVHLLLDFVANMSCYLIFKASNEVNLHTHPLMKRILLHEVLLKELETIENQLQLSITQCWIEMMNSKDVDSECLSFNRHLSQTSSEDVGSRCANMSMVGTCQNLKLSPKLKLSQLICDLDGEAVKPDVESTEITSPPIKKSRVAGSFTENITVARYKMLTCSQLSEEQAIQLGVKKNNSELLFKNDVDDIMDENKSSYAVINDGRRSITYEIHKNRGLTPKRKKEHKNPRVKNRLKYRKAKIRRRGQIREVRREHKPYTGELSGIRAAVKRGTHLK